MAIGSFLLKEKNKFSKNMFSYPSLHEYFSVRMHSVPLLNFQVWQILQFLPPRILQRYCLPRFVWFEESQSLTNAVISFWWHFFFPFTIQSKTAPHSEFGKDCFPKGALWRRRPVKIFSVTADLCRWAQRCIFSAHAPWERWYSKHKANRFLLPKFTVPLWLALKVYMIAKSVVPLCQTPLIPSVMTASLEPPRCFEPRDNSLRKTPRLFMELPQPATFFFSQKNPEN